MLLQLGYTLFKNVAEDVKSYIRGIKALSLQNQCGTQPPRRLRRIPASRYSQPGGGPSHSAPGLGCVTDSIRQK